MKHVCFSLRGVLIFTLVLVSSLTAYWSITLTANWSASKNAQNIAAQFGVEMAAVTLSLHQGEIPPPDNTGVSWRIVTGDKFDEPTRRNWSQTLFRLSPPTEAIDTPLLVRVTLQASALDASRPIPGDTLADQFSYLSSRIAALNTRGLIKVQISDSRWVEFRAPDIWTTRLTTVQILLLVCLWIGILSTVAGVMSAYIMRHFNRITTYAGALLNTKPPPLLSEKSGPIEVREMSAALNLVNHDIAASIVERTHFLAAISHDLRTPVTRMRLRTEQIDDTSVSMKLLSDLDEITNMISEAINFLRDGVEEEELENVLFATFVRSICDDYIDVGKNVVFEEIEPLQMRSTGTIFDPRTVVYDIKSPRNITLQCQPNRLRRAINNLIDNALKYGDAARVRIEADATSIMVRINDQGSGLDADQMELVFQPFYRVEGSRNRSHGGAGLGLPLAKSVIEAHGGTITLFNHDRGGLEVRMVLPRTM